MEDALNATTEQIKSAAAFMLVWASDDDVYEFKARLDSLSNWVYETVQPVLNEHDKVCNGSMANPTHDTEYLGFDKYVENRWDGLTHEQIKAKFRVKDGRTWRGYAAAFSRYYDV